MDSHPPLPQLEAFGLGRLDPQGSAEVEAHVTQCDPCRALLEQLPADELMVLVRNAETLRSSAVPLRLHEGYEILEEIGRGGMAVVCRARQRGLGRIVALKRILHGIEATPEELARFQREAEAVARLSHPNIVQIYDIGEQDGQPYLALEYVPGRTLAQQLLRGPLAPRPAAQLVETLARAIEYAHSCGIIHRDLKPSNVLMGQGNLEISRASEGATLLEASLKMPKIADFGLAKQQGKTLDLTQTGALLGTPSYMAPEQTTGQPHEVGPSVDGYALGAILYECLTGRPPFRGVTALETLEQVRHHDPVPPRRFQPGVPRDLEIIALKCLEKDPKRRFASAGDLADDLRRWLDGVPIRARPVPVWEQVVRWTRRRPAWAALALVSTLSLTLLGSGGWVASARLRSAVRDTEAARRRAEENYHKAQTAIHQMWGLGAYRLTDVPETLEIRESMLNEALRLYEGLLPDDPREDPRSANQYAELLVSLALLRNEQHRPAEAEQWIREALARLRQLMTDFPEDRSHRISWGVAWHELGYLCQSQNRSEEAESAFKSAIGAMELEDSESHKPPRVLVRTYSNLAGFYQAKGHTQEAETLFRKGIRAAEILLADQPEDEYIRESAATLIHDWGLYLSRQGQIEEARVALRRAAALLEPMADNRPGARRFLAPLAGIYETLAMNEAEPSKIEDLLKKSISFRERLVRQFPEQPGRAEHLARGLANLGSHYYQQDRLTESENLLLRAASLGERLVKEHPENSYFHVAHAETLNNLGLAQARVRPETARGTYDRALQILDPLIRKFPQELRYRRTLGAVQLNLSGLLLSQNQAADALKQADRAIKTLEEVQSKDQGNVETASYLLNALGQRGRAHTACNQHREAAADYERVVALAPEKDKDGYRLLHGIALATSGQHVAACAAVKPLNEKKDLNLDDRYNVACVYALSAAAAARDEGLPAPVRPQRANQHAHEALAILQHLYRSGYFQTKEKVEHLSMDPDLKFLHEKTEFQKLLKDLQHK